MLAASCSRWLERDSHRIMERRWSLHALCFRSPRFVSIALAQAFQPIFINAMSDLDVDVLKFLHAKQNALSSLTLYSSHGKFSYQRALKQRFLRPFGNDANLDCEGPQSTLSRSSQEAIIVAWNWVPLSEAVPCCIICEVVVSSARSS